MSGREIISEESLPESALDVLKAVSERTSRLEVESKSALRLGNADGYLSLLRERAQLVADLPTSLSQLQERGIDVSEEVASWAESHSYMAIQQIETNNPFGMSSLLYRRGSKIGDPSELQELISRIEPPNRIQK